MYDYIVVGAGSAGCVLANRLTEDPGTSVLVIEAGGNDDDPAIHDPNAYLSLWRTAVDWAHGTEEEPQLNNRKEVFSQGKVLGGSGSINGMLYVRGNRADYDGWRASGNAGWGYDDVLPYFKKAENWEGPASDHRGKGGPLTVTGVSSVSPLLEAFLAAGEELGWPRTDDYNGASQEGFGTFQYTIRQGRRESPAGSYLHPARSRSNLTIWTDTLVARVVAEGTRATGVAYLDRGTEQQVRAIKEVVLCGGTIKSAQLLMLSGIGPADGLRALGIPVVADLPGVGKNLQNHVLFMTHNTTRQPLPATGVFPEGIAYVKSHPRLAVPDLPLMYAPFPPSEQKLSYVVAVLLAHPRSRGHLTLRTADATAGPMIFANYLADPADRQALVEGVKLARRVNRSRALAPFYAEEAVPGRRVQSDADILEHLRDHAEHTCHQVGTCKMGRDVLPVVDDQLRVHGVQGLRVMDASVMPSIINANTHAATIMIAERGADLLRGPCRGIESSPGSER